MTASSASEQTLCVAAGAVPLAATPVSSNFELGPAPWHDTDGDQGNGDPGMVVNDTDSTTITVTSGSKCVWACCPFTNGAGCPTADQCP
jgi:hypothetical protein